LRISYPGAFYHVTSRGNERKAVFKSSGDREKFLEYLSTASLRYDARVHAYCLMDNHYHLLLQTPSANLPEIMHHINGAYTTYFNVKRDRAGHLFQGRYKAILVEIDGYAKELSRYVHLNPVRAKIVHAPEEYPWSSYRDYIGMRRPLDWLYRDFILGCFDAEVSKAEDRYRDFVTALVDQAYACPMEAVLGSTLLGGADFILSIKKNYLSRRKPDKDLPALKQLEDRVAVKTICEEVEAAFSGQKRLARSIQIYLCQKYARRKLKDIGAHFGIRESGVCQAVRRVAERMKVDQRLKEEIETIEKRFRS
jgi:REP element-mobilizing transposase RayT